MYVKIWGTSKLLKLLEIASGYCQRTPIRGSHVSKRGYDVHNLQEPPSLKAQTGDGVEGGSALSSKASWTYSNILI